MRERPILFSGPMVRAILDGRKTQTRRVVKPQPADCQRLARDPSSPSGYSLIADAYDDEMLRCPYGIPGDRLWVREEHYRYGHWESVPGVRTKTGRMKWRFVADSYEVRFDAPPVYRKGRHHKDAATPAWHKRLARFMPRWASRLTLEITDVRVQRVQDISGEDAADEGVNVARCGCDVCRMSSVMCPADASSHILEFASLWELINAKRGHGWDANPWVWAITFRRVGEGEA